MKIDRDIFWKNFRQHTVLLTGKKTVSQAKVNAIEFLLGKFISGTALWPISWVAYAFATIAHETAFTYEPIVERGDRSYFDKYDAGTALGKRLGNIVAGDGYRYRGRGYVQITGRANYKKFDIESSPERALEPDTAFNILVVGMKTGSFTGKKLSDYLNLHTTDYVNARRIINGKDKAQDIARLAAAFEEILSSAAASQNGKPEVITETKGAGLVPPPATDGSLSSDPPPIGIPIPMPTVPVAPQVPDGSQAVVVERGERTEIKEGFFKKLWLKIVGGATALGGVDAITDKAQQAQALGLPTSFWTRLFYVLIALAVAWILYEIWTEVIQVWLINRRKEAHTKYLMALAETPLGVVSVAPSEDLKALEAKGWTVVRRG